MEQLSVLASLFLIVIVGFVVGRLKLLGEESVKTFNTFLFYIAIPSVVFISLIGTNKEELSLYPKFIIVNIAISIISYLLIYVFLRVFVESHKSRGGILFSSVSGNVVFFGFPILLNVFGQEHLNLGIIYSVMVFAVVDLVGFLLISLDSEKKLDFLAEVREFLKNPIVIATFLGLIFLLFEIPVPGLIFDTLDNLSKGITAMGLVTLGIFVSYNIDFREIRLSLLTSSLKLLFIPVFTYLVVFHLISLEQNLAEVSVIQSSMPVAVFSLTVADIYGLNKRLVSNGIIVSSILFLLTSAFWIWVL